MKRKMYSVDYVKSLEAKAKERVDDNNAQIRVINLVMEKFMDFIDSKGLDNELSEYIEQFKEEFEEAAGQNL